MKSRLARYAVLGLGLVGVVVWLAGERMPTVPAVGPGGEPRQAGGYRVPAVGALPDGATAGIGGENALPRRVPDRLRHPEPRQAQPRFVAPDRDRLASRVRSGLVDPDPEIRIAAIHEAYGLAPGPATRLLQGVLVTERNGAVYEQAAAALAAIAGEAAVSDVTAALDEPDSERRGDAVDALGRLGEDGIHLLGQVLLGDQDPELRLRAARLLAEIASPAAFALLSAAASDPDPRIGRVSGDAAATRDPADIPVPAGNGGNPAWVDDPGDPGAAIPWDSEPEQRIEAVRLLYSVEEQTAVSALKTILERDADVTVRQEALLTLEQIGGDAAENAIATALGDDASELRRSAVEALWFAEHPYRVPALGQVIYADPDPALRAEAVRMLGSDRDPAARLLLEVARTDPDPAVSALARRLLQ